MTDYYCKPANMRNRKQLLADFYLALLALPNDAWRTNNKCLYAEVLATLSADLDEAPETVQNIFKRMAREDQQ